MNIEELAIRQLAILAVDDDHANLLLLQRILEREGYTRVQLTTEPARAAELFVRQQPDLVLLDLHMPGIDGLELMQRLAPLSDGVSSVPFVVLTADVTEETKRRALSLGARDFLTKPVDRIELLLRVRNLLEVKALQDRLVEQNLRLEGEVAERTSDLEQSRMEMLERLALAAEYRDDDTQEHAWRIGRACAQLARELGWPADEVELIGRAAPLHDIGKIGISDLILLKPGRLTDEEFEIIKTHARIGAEILAGSRSPLLRLAEQIALTHHERWDGLGYPQGLRGEQIPVEGRIAAVADVFDALAYERPYKRAWPVDDAVSEIMKQSGSQFDPAVVAAFRRLDHANLLDGVAGWKAAALAPDSGGLLTSLKEAQA